MLVKTDCLIGAIPCELPMCRLSAQKVVVRIETIGRLTFSTFHFSGSHAQADCANHAGGNSILQIEYVLKGPVKFVRPQVRAGSCVNQLPRDPHAIARLSN